MKDSVQDLYKKQLFMEQVVELVNEQVALLREINISLRSIRNQVEKTPQKTWWKIW